MLYWPSRAEVRGADYAKSRGLFDKADQAEIKKLQMMNAFERVDPQTIGDDVEVLGSRFVRTWKVQQNAPVKAASRLVVQGHQEAMADVDEDWVDPPSGTRESLKILLAEAVRRKWLVWSQDVTRAFLQSNKK